MDQRIENLPSGKTVIRDYADDGQLTKEMHAYGALDIACSMSFSGGTKVEELYFVKQRMVARTRYEKARLNFSDMPAADESIEDAGAELNELVRKERRRHLEASKLHKPDPKQAEESDAFCVGLMDEGECRDAITWINSESHTLGEFDHAKSCKLLERLTHCGCRQIFACQIDRYDDGLENTGHLVVELPKETTVRQETFREIDKLARSRGFCAPFDDGQSYAYIHLD
jgi:hypothetical protein